MAENIVSPGVFTRENDLSFLPQGVGAIGAAIVGPTVKGPAFVPTVVKSFAEFERRFGPLSSETYVPQTVREYLRNAGSVTVCRVLAGGGYTYTNGTNEIVALAVSGAYSVTNAAGVATKTTNNILLGAIYPSKASSTPDLGASTFLSTNTNKAEHNFNDDFKLTLSGSNVTTGRFTASLDPSKSNYLFKQLGYNPNNSKTAANTYAGNPGYTYVNFKKLQESIIGAATKEVSTVTFGANFNTGSIDETAGYGTGIILTEVGGAQYTIGFSSDNSAAATGGGLTGSRIHTSIAALDTPLTSTHGFASISGSILATSLMTAVNSITNDGGNPFTASAAGLVTTITSNETGEAVDIATSFSAATASVAVTTQGTELAGYNGLNSSREVFLITQSSNIVYNGEIGQSEGYGYASTPWIHSQIALGRKELFKFHTLDHGKQMSSEYKISISNLREPGDIDGIEQYSQFSVLVRKYSDNDKSSNQVILEQFNNVNLDPDSPNYISRVIGDRYPQYNDTLDKVELLGNYPNISNHIRVEVSTAVDERATSPKLSPKGFAAVKDTVNTAALGTSCTFPSASFEGVQTLEGEGRGAPINYSANGFLGFKFTEKASDNENFIKPLPQSALSNVTGDFSVENYKGHPSSSLWVGSLSASIDVTGATGPKNTQLQFSVPFQGGDDGIAPHTIKQIGSYITATNLYGFDLSSTTKAGYKGYKKAIDILSNQDEYDINMLALPGVIHALHPLVTNAGIDMCEDRGDAFFVMDLNGVDASVNTAVSNVSGLDTSYAAVYYPWVKVLDTAKNKPVLVPPSVIVPGAIAASDAIGAEWFAPAGLNRGILGNVIEAKIRLNQAERDTLYDSKINPIATFPATGVCIWGQKTLQERSTALDRINVRRLLLAVKKFIASSSKYLVFEQNTTATRNRFLNIANPYLESIQQRQGLFAFRVVMDESNNTPTEIDRNQLVGAIYLQPTKTAEFIILDFNILPTGATFPS